jgi:hypothetical protein
MVLLTSLYDVGSFKVLHFQSSLNQIRHEHPLVAPQVSHFKHVPLRTMVKLPHSPQASPT